ncbi:hypothetical protein HDE_05692 [Halotydeus destructor]|nr:hypothetical protein HDE_05692 [Halotydeus destructor]
MNRLMITMFGLITFSLVNCYVREVYAKNTSDSEDGTKKKTGSGSRRIADTGPLGFTWYVSPATNNRYLFYSEPFGFLAALQFCSRNGAQLPTRVDNGERKWIYDNISGQKYFWLGALNVPNTTYFANWLDGSDLNWEYTLTPALREEGYGGPCEALHAVANGRFSTCVCDGCRNVHTVCVVAGDSASER